MKRSYPIAASLALAAALAAPLAAQASTVTAHAGLTNLTLELIDLTPDDGKNPWIAFFSTTTQASVESAPPYESDVRTTSGAIGISNSYGSTHASTSLTNFGAALQFSSDHPDGYADARGHRNDVFTLSPNTTLRVTATAGVSGATIGHILLDSISSLELTLLNVNGMGYAYEMDKHDWSVDGNGISELSVSVSTGSFIQNGRINAMARTTAWVTAVPEPSTYGMLLAGLGIIGAVARRKAQQRG